MSHLWTCPLAHMLTQNYLQYLPSKQEGLINVSRVKSTAFVKCVPLLIWHLRLLESLIHVRLTSLALAKTYTCSLGIFGFGKDLSMFAWHFWLWQRRIHVRLAFLALAKTYPCSLGTLGLRCLSEHLLFTTAAGGTQWIAADKSDTSFHLLFVLKREATLLTLACHRHTW